MGTRKNGWLGKFANSYPAQVKKPLVELLGQNRVLVENYRHVLDYTPKRIRISVSFGEICVDGCGLAMSYMCADQLVISGTIENIALFRG